MQLPTYSLGGLLAMALALSGSGCKEDDLTEFLIPGSASPPRVMAAYPPDGTKSLIPEQGIWILFDRPMDKGRTERAFSLTGPDGEIPGGFSWQARTRLEFHASRTLKEAGSYSIRVESSAESATGTDLNRQYRASFSLSADTKGPSLIHSRPGDGQEGVPKEAIPELEFSEPVSFASLDRGIQITPDFSYVLELESGTAESSTVKIRPASHLQTGLRYRIDLSRDIQDRHGNALQNPQVISFFTGSDHERPRIESVQLSGEELEAGKILDGAKKSGPLQIFFSEPMNTVQVEENLSVANASGNISNISWNNAEDTVTVSVSLDSESYYEVRVDTGAEDRAGNSLSNPETFPFFTDAIDSRRPELLFVEQDRVTGPGPVDGSERLEDYLPEIPDYGIVDASQTVDMDETTGLHEALVFRLLFDSDMEITSLYESLHFVPVLDTGNSELSLHSLKYGGEKNEIIVYASWIPPGQQASASPVYALQIESGATDTNDNEMGSRFRRFLSF